MGDPVRNYGQLMDKLLTGSIQPVQFQQLYLDHFKREEFLEEPLFQVLDRLFGAVDAYCADPEIRKSLSDSTINELELLVEVRKARSRLADLENRDG